MKLKDVQVERKEKKNIRINLKTTQTISKWMKTNSVSPQMVFDKTLKELMEEQ